MSSSFVKTYIESAEFLLITWLAEAKQLIIYFRTNFIFSLLIKFSWHAYWRENNFRLIQGKRNSESDKRNLLLKIIE